MTARAESLLLTLLYKLRWLTFQQIGRLLEVGSLAAVQRLVSTLEDGRLVRRTAVFLPCAEMLRAPIALWKPGAGTPPFEVISYRAAERWSGPKHAQTLAFATPRAARLFGGHAGRLQHAARAHDLHVAEVYLHFRRTRSEDAMDWVSEATLASERDGQVLPDAAIVDRDGSPRLIIEVLGHYTKARLARFHDDCAARGLPYELW